MDARSASRFPHLDHFLNAYMHQDWQLFGDTLEAVVGAYAADTYPEGADRLREEIDQFLRFEGVRLEADYPRLYPNSVLPSGWHMTAAEWLRWVARLAGNRALVH